MERRGGCCIAMYGGGGGGGDMSKVERLMMRYRPIAPKPIGSSISGGSTPEIIEKCGRGKRKYVKDKRCNNKKRKPSSPSKKKVNKEGGGVTCDNVTTTLSLLPESPEFTDSLEERSSQSLATTLISFERDNKEYKMVNVAPARVVGSCVTVDCVTDTWVNLGVLQGLNDEERRLCLERDTCPGFVSDRYGRVVWTNVAYRSMVGQEKETDDVKVCLVVKKTAMVSAVAFPAFTCRVRVQYACGSLTVPCDVWRMEGGGFAWRLDVKAALCLGRP